MNANTPSKPDENDWEILAHAAKPGYPKAFKIIFLVAAVYFIHIFVYSFFKTL